MRDIESKMYAVKGDVVRSLLERRWLLFFSRLGIDFEYEPERFPDGVSSIGYLPDILIHGKLYLEIKPTLEIARQESRKPYGFVRQTNKRLLVVIGAPPGERMIAIIKTEDNKVAHRDVSWVSWEHLCKKTDVDSCREKAAANHAINDIDISLATPIHRVLSALKDS